MYSLSLVASDKYVDLTRNLGSVALWYSLVLTYIWLCCLLLLRVDSVG